MQIFLSILTGLTAGFLSGVLGIGGGIIIIPALVYIFGLSQHQAQGTTLAAMVLPIGLLAAIKYYQAGNVKIGISLLVALGFFIGAFFGAGMVQNISDPMLKKGFGIFLAVVALQMILGK
ncbi:MAG: sulfite exporter TauE/SafE family protein [Candidatus Omnitrophica bacterium]|nr:sulfite exporter TauE/SafE family protein [Candidatus Omnitrophota bacterium]